MAASESSGGSGGPVGARSAKVLVELFEPSSAGGPSVEIEVDMVVSVFSDAVWVHASDTGRPGTIVRAVIMGAADDAAEEAAALIDDGGDGFARDNPKTTADRMEVYTLIGRREEEDPLPSLFARRLLRELSSIASKETQMVSALMLTFGVRGVEKSQLAARGVKGDAVLQAQRELVTKLTQAAVQLRASA